MGGREKVGRRKPTLAKSSCFQGWKAQSDCAKDVKKFGEMKGMGIFMELYRDVGFSKNEKLRKMQF